MVKIQNFELIRKVKLTNDIFKMEFEGENKLDFLYGQFITFILPKIWWRAYSILKAEWKNIILIIKKRKIAAGWRWWSKFICELNIWEKLKWVWPAWHFTLQKNNNSKLFLGTWTWFVPLYNQIKWALENNLWTNIQLLFWLRNLSDIFYEKELIKLKNNYNNFDYKIYLSREKKSNYNKWYITDYLWKQNISNFQEFYICWAPSMIQNSKKILENSWIIKENIFSEEY